MRHDHAGWPPRRAPGAAGAPTPGLLLLSALLLAALAAALPATPAGIHSDPAAANAAVSSGGGIPKLIHQSWKTRELPPQFQSYA
ncbi:hypothetical protein MNEG_8393, partial [Monoraphidium neglectum]